MKNTGYRQNFGFLVTGYLNDWLPHFLIDTIRIFFKSLPIGKYIVQRLFYQLIFKFFFEECSFYLLVYSKQNSILIHADGSNLNNHIVRRLLLSEYKNNRNINKKPIITEDQSYFIKLPYIFLKK